MDGDTNGRLFSLFESDVEPRAGEPSFVSSLTGSGLSTVKTQRQSLKLPWALGIFAAFLSSGCNSVLLGPDKASPKRKT
jgi:hypothetical protein